MPYALPPHAPPTREDGPFAPLVHLPRRKSTDRRPIFSLGVHTPPTRSAESDEDDDSSPPTTSPLHVPRILPLLPLNALEAVPFPTIGGGPASPVVPTHDRAASEHIPRTPSHPIILSNGKPLKPSLKSKFSASAPHLPPHARSQSAPSTPATPPPKNVHFPERGDELQRVRVFRPAGRPLAVSAGAAADETETETEQERPAPGFPFPAPPSGDDAPPVLDAPRCSPVPGPHSVNAPGHVVLETLQLPRARPSTLCGSVLVRNVAFSKTVVIRFTLDEWQTTSEVAARYVSSLQRLPPPFPAHAAATPEGWDRWAFSIRLEDVGRRLADRTLWLAVRFAADGAEWWDNNAGANYRAAFVRAPPTSAPAAPRPPLIGSMSFPRPTPPQALSFGPMPAAAPAPAAAPRAPKLSLTLKNYAPPALVPAHLPSPPDSARASPVTPLHPLPIFGGQPATPATPPPSFSPEVAPFSPSADARSPVGDASYAALVRQWCFHQPGGDALGLGAGAGAGWQERRSPGASFGMGVGLGAEVA